MRVAVICVLLLALAGPTQAYVFPGDPAPAFSKNELVGPPWAAGPLRTLADYSGKVIVFFLFGYNCPVCIPLGPSVEADIHQYYAQRNPGQVQVIGVDNWNGTPTQLGGFKTTTGATYPLLLNGGTSTGGNFEVLYGPWDNFIVVNKQGIVRYHADIAYEHGNRYHLDEIRGTVDSLVTTPVGVGPATPRLALSAAPNPVRTRTAIELAVPQPGTLARVTVHDLQGRRVATLHDGPVGAVTSWSWDGASATGARLGAGVFLLRAEVGRETLVRRLVLLP